MLFRSAHYHHAHRKAPARRDKRGIVRGGGKKEAAAKDPEGQEEGHGLTQWQHRKPP